MAFARSLVCPLLIIWAAVVTMTDRVLIVINEQNGWSVQLNGVDVAKFFGPHAQEWAFRERDELIDLFDAQATNLADR